MGLRLCSMSSGSRGNSVIIQSDSMTLLIDAGIPVTSAARSLSLFGVKALKLLITHTHSDHIRHIGGFIKRFDCEVYCHAASFAILRRKLNTSKLIPVEGDFYAGDITVSPFKVSHDVHCVGYAFYCSGKKIGYATDLGRVDRGVIDALCGSDIVFLESNHDEQLLLNNAGYPLALKRRILSDYGHLSNEACAKAAAELVRGGVKQFILGHLSQENNYPELAYSTVSGYLKSCGLLEDKSVNIEVAEFDKLSSVFEIS